MSKSCNHGIFLNSEFSDCIRSHSRMFCRMHEINFSMLECLERLRHDQFPYPCLYTEAVNENSICLMGRKFAIRFVTQRISCADPMASQEKCYPLQVAIQFSQPQSPFCHSKPNERLQHDISNSNKKEPCPNDDKGCDDVLF